MINLLYFSGTGNTLHIANELHKCFEDSQTTSIISLLKKETSIIEGDIIGFIFPIYAFSIPNVLKELLINKKYTNGNYFFAVSSRHCSVKVFKLIDKLLKRQNKQLNAGFSIQAPENYIPTFNMPTQKDIDDFDYELKHKLDQIKDIVNNRKNSINEDSFVLSVFANTLFKLMTFLHNKLNYFNIYNNFYTDNNCNSCGQCKRICLSNRTEIINGKPIWNKSIDCYYCLACIQYCPQHAIQMKIGNTKNKSRYNYPGISANEIANQKST